MSETAFTRTCVALCQSGKFETGQGTCAPICMEFLGNPRRNGCGHAVTVHGKLAEQVIQAARGETPHAG